MSECYRVWMLSSSYQVLNWTLAMSSLSVAPWTKSSTHPPGETWVSQHSVFTNPALTNLSLTNQQAWMIVNHGITVTVFSIALLCVLIIKDMAIWLFNHIPYSVFSLVLAQSTAT